uniref:Putative secreted peptide n=1 Tax=Anopheles braziliensis TaxID=58242 RepID=A0A2M3ZV83_9DIPT
MSPPWSAECASVLVVGCAARTEQTGLMSSRRSPFSECASEATRSGHWPHAQRWPTRANVICKCDTPEEEEQQQHKKGKDQPDHQSLPSEMTTSTIGYDGATKFFFFGF